jgi:hypothetical protein
MRDQGGFSTRQKGGAALTLFGIGLPLLQWGLEARGVSLSPAQGNLLLVLAALSFLSGLSIILWSWVGRIWSWAWRQIKQRWPFALARTARRLRTRLREAERELQRLRPENERLKLENRNQQVELDQVSKELGQTKHDKANLRHERNDLQGQVHTLQNQAAPPPLSELKKLCLHLAEELEQEDVIYKDGETAIQIWIPELEEKGLSESEIDEKVEDARYNNAKRALNRYKKRHRGRLLNLYDALGPREWFSPSDRSAFDDPKDPYYFSALAKRLREVCDKWADS